MYINCIITDLDLTSNKILDKGAEHIANAVQHNNCCLVSLDLEENQIGIRGAQSFHWALARRYIFSPLVTLKGIDLNKSPDLLPTFRNVSNEIILKHFHSHNLATCFQAMVDPLLTSMDFTSFKLVEDDYKRIGTVLKLPTVTINNIALSKNGLVGEGRNADAILMAVVHEECDIIMIDNEINLLRWGVRNRASANLVRVLLRHRPNSLHELDDEGKLPLNYACEDQTQREFPTLENLELCQVLYHATSPAVQDGMDRDRNTIVKILSTNIFVRKWAKALGAYLGRYKIDDGPPIHISSTSRVVFATDLLSKSIEEVCKDDTGEIREKKPRVVLKIMCNHSEFTREIISRYGVATDDLQDCAIRIRGWHINNEDARIPENTLRKTNREAYELPEHALQDEFVLVMDMGSSSLFHEITSQRIAGHLELQVVEIFRSTVKQVNQLHNHGLIHSDIKPRNILQMLDGSRVLCDLDSALISGSIRDKTFKCSSAYTPPEQARFLFASASSPTVTEKFDVWSLGVLLYELCTGLHLFSQDISDDNMTSVVDKIRLCVWHCITDAELLPVFGAVDDMIKSHDAKSLIRWCLRGDPEQRPTIKEVLNHPFLQISSPNNVPQLMKYHFFISHMQMEASGNVGTIYFMLEKLGCHCWRDMNQKDLTEAGMKQGVIDSDVFVLFMTNSVLSRPFCLKEINWALEANKPIIVIQEDEERFWPFDINRWRKDQCTKDTTVWPHVWRKTEDLGCDYLSCPNAIKNEIERQHCSDLILPYRRRDFEARAMVRRMLHQAGKLGCVWARNIPGTELCPEVGMRKLLLVCDSSDRSGMATVDERCRIHKVLVTSLKERSDVKLVNDPAVATHAIVVLTGGLLLPNGPKIPHLEAIVRRLSPVDIVYLYSMEAGWKFYGIDHNSASPNVKNSITRHEALLCRTLKYEHDAVVQETLRRLCPKIEVSTDTKITRI